MSTTATTPAAIVALAATLGVTAPQTLAKIDPFDALGALYGIARGRADDWAKLDTPAAATIAQGYDALASECLAAQRELLDPAPAEDMDYRLSSL
jgi:hypothetical protein